MENIVIVEKLCEKLQESDRPTDLGVAIALRVILDENIILAERTEESNVQTTKYKQANTRVVQRCIDLINENTVLKKLNAELNTSLEISAELLKVYKQEPKMFYRVDEKHGRMSGKLFTYLKPSIDTVNPTQGKIDFPDTRSALTATPVNTREKSVYYKMAEWRAKRIYDVYCKDPDWFILGTSHIVPWVNKFFLKPGEKLTLSHIEYACLPKCYAGLGTAVGIQLYSWAQKNKNFVK